jgi:four helix bundle protein
MSNNGFRKLRIWQDAMNIVKEVYQMTSSFTSHEQFGLSSQMRRAAISIPSNVAEGQARQSVKENLYHISFAQASAAELETQIEICLLLDYLIIKQHEDLMQKIWTVRKQLYGLYRSLNQCNPAKSKIQNPASRIHDPKSMINAPTSKIHDPKSNKGGLM